MATLPKNERRTAEAPTKRTMWLYGSPFSGKTTFADSAPDPLMLNTDGNAVYVTAPYVSIQDEITVNGRITQRKMAWQVFKEYIEELKLRHAADILLSSDISIKDTARRFGYRDPFHFSRRFKSIKSGSAVVEVTIEEGIE